ncbi:hypothetical protein [Ideonella oryzae]|uniref:Uncharacterized protein n=1 Tax=Ideonella oryzae TaxID=2937441 RepID=A0ABT1BQC5_9BURK|nr:hypothetical protein [Ideonella oryzae]MCO5978109.1 hypothetical protein [Ideonella oryzae]
MKSISNWIILALIPIQVSASDIDKQRSSPEGRSSGSEIDNSLGLLIDQQEVVLHQDFRFNDRRDEYQCQGAMGRTATRINDWTPPIRINTDGGWGGCTLAWAITDPKNTLKDLKIKIGYSYGNGQATGECGTPSESNIEITKIQPSWMPKLQIDTDDRPSWCNLRFEIEGRNDIELNVKFFADDSGVDQCKNRLPADKWHTVKAGQPLTIGLDTDGRYGGCQLSLRISKKT